MIGLVLLPLVGAVGVATWWAHWRQLRKLPAVAARYPRPSVPIEVTLTAVLPEASTAMIVFRHTRRGFDRRCALHNSSSAHSLVVERTDDGLIVEQLEQWCTTAAPVVLFQDRTAQKASFRDKASGISIVLALLSPITDDQP